MEDTKKKLTPEEMVKQADDHFKSEIRKGNYQTILKKMVTLGRYTLRNQMLILAQNPDASTVNSMTQWNYRRKSIRPGEKALKIISPMFAKQVSVGANGEVIEKTLDKITGFEVRFVFDESQTEGEPIKDILNANIEEDKYDVIKEALKATVKGFEFCLSDTLEEGTDAILDTESGTVLIRNGLSKDKEVKTLINQIAAANVLTRNRKNFHGLHSQDLGNITGFEIAGASYVVGNRLGYEMPFIEPNFENMSDDAIQRFADNVSVIRSVSQRMITAVENAFEWQIKAEKEARKSQDSAHEVSNIATTPQDPPKPKKRTQSKKTEVCL